MPAAPTKEQPPSHVDRTNQEYRHEHETLVRAKMTARLGEAQQLLRGHQLAMARRLGRKAEQAAEQARLALARTI